MKLRYLICLIFNKRMVDNFNKVSNIKYLLAINFNNTVYYTSAPVNLKFAKPDSKLKPLNNIIKQISGIINELVLDIESNVTRRDQIYKGNIVIWKSFVKTNDFLIHLKSYFGSMVTFQEIKISESINNIDLLVYTLLESVILKGELDDE